jgi:hypothetical protein
MASVYVVMGTSGEYSDRDEWPVAAYASKAEAEAHVRGAAAWARAYEAATDRYGRTPPPSPWDPRIKMDYNGTGYYVMDAPMRDYAPVASTQPTAAEIAYDPDEDEPPTGAAPTPQEGGR